MKSIKRKLISGILLILSTFLLGIFVYNLTFKNYFEIEKSLEMKKIVLEIEKNIINDANIDVNDLILNVSNKNNVEVEIRDVISHNILFSTHRAGKNEENINLMKGLNKFQTIESTQLEDNILKQFVYDKPTGVKFLSINKICKDINYDITIRIPISSIDDAVKKSSMLLLMIFIPITIIIIIFTLIFSKKFTKPIIDIKNKTVKIINLDFSDSIEIKSNDEVSELAESVNVLSNKISDTLSQLNNKNLELTNMIEKERKNHELRREFISSVSHELKSPIAVISGYAQILNEGIIQDVDEVKNYINIINEESNRMNVIVSDLLDLYKFQSNTFKLNINKVCIDKLIENIIFKNAIIFKNNNIDLNIDLQNSFVLGDKIRLEQVIQNYINNAISHVDNNKKIIISTRKEDNYISIYVFNSGIPIAKENIKKIWNGFVRVDKVRNYKEKRVGLGLAIVSQITRLHNGKCGVKNKENGVEFYIRLKALDN